MYEPRLLGRQAVRWRVSQSVAPMGEEQSARRWAGLPVLVHCESDWGRDVRSRFPPVIAAIFTYPLVGGARRERGRLKIGGTPDVRTGGRS